MSAEENKAIVRRTYEEVWNKGNLVAANEFLAPNMVRHAPGTPKGSFVVTTLRRAFPDLHITIEDMVAEGDKVATRWAFRGTHKGEFMGIPPTDKQVTFTGLEIARFTDGKCVEHWLNWDALGFMQQLGSIPPMNG